VQIDAFALARRDAEDRARRLRSDLDSVGALSAAKDESNSERIRQLEGYVLCTQRPHHCASACAQPTL
jgi:hypothetical protein